MQTLGGYTLETKLGAGGMGAVWRATHPRFPGREFALKVLLGDEPPSAKAYERFRREIQALAAVSEHPNIVKIFGFANEGDRPYIVMELVKGRSLQGMAKEKGLEPKEAARIVREIADALVHAHAQGVVHRDLKPENILVEGATGRPRVCDFGLARVADSERLTRSGAFLGTPAYAAPEQIDGRSHLAREKADVYSLGGLLFFTLTGRPPFISSGNALTKSVLLETPPRASSITEGVPADLDAVCLKALEKEPHLRYASAEALRDELDRFLADEPVLASVPSRLKVLRRALAKRKRLVLAVALGALVVLGTGAVVFTQSVLSARAEDRRIKSLFDASMRPGASYPDMEGALGSIPAERPERQLLARHMAEVRLEKNLRELRERPVASTDDADLAEIVSDSLTLGVANLVGERGDGLSLGDAILERRDRCVETADDKLPPARRASRARALLDAASALAEHELAERPAAARALRARATLARLGAPRVALGPGRLDGAAEALDAARADLDAAASLAGAPGAHAAWLLADLHCLAGDRVAAKAAIEVAASKAPAHAARAPLEKALAESRDEAVVFTELAARASTEPAAAFTLSRVLALRGRPALIERPELAAAPDAAAIAAIVQRDDPGAFAFATPVRPKEYDPVHVRIRELRVQLDPPSGLGIFSGNGSDGELEAAMLRRAREHGAEYEALLAELVRTLGLDLHVLEGASQSYRRFTSSAIFRVLRARYEVSGGYDISFAFSGLRDLSRVSTGSSDYFFADEWDPQNLRGRALVEWFDRKVAEDAGRDAPLATLVAASPENGRLLLLAARAVGAMRRLEEAEKLHRPEPGGDSPEVAALAFEALRDVGDLVVLAPASALPFRARAVRLAVPGALGEALATLDLQRALRVARAIPRGDDWASNYAALATAIAGERVVTLPGRFVGDDLYRVTLDRIHTQCVFDGLGAKVRGEEAPRTSCERMAGTWLERFTVHTFLKGLVNVVSRDQFEKDVKPRPVDLDILERFKDKAEYLASLERGPEKPAR